MRERAQKVWYTYLDVRYLTVKGGARGPGRRKISTSPNGNGIGNIYGSIIRARTRGTKHTDWLRTTKRRRESTNYTTTLNHSSAAPITQRPIPLPSTTT